MSIRFVQLKRVDLELETGDEVSARTRFLGLVLLLGEVFLEDRRLGLLLEVAFALDLLCAIL